MTGAIIMNIIIFLTSQIYQTLYSADFTSSATIVLDQVPFNVDLLSLLLKQTANQSSGLYTLAYFILHIATSHRLELSLKEKKTTRVHYCLQNEFRFLNIPVSPYPCSKLPFQDLFPTICHQTPTTQFCTN